MASRIYDELALQTANGGINLESDDIRFALLSTNTTADTDKDSIQFVGDIGTLDEFDGAGYARAALANKTVTKNDAQDRAEFSSDPFTIASMAAGTRDVDGVLIYKHVTNDSDSPVCGYCQFAAPETPNGNDFTVTPPSNGWFQHNATP